jgi:glycine betaine/proline transport system ATP-binding protein
MSESGAAVVVQHLYKVFGRRPEQGLKLLQQGLGKREIFDESRMSVGVDDASFEVGRGETFVVMGLSGSGKSTLLRMLNRLIEPTAGKVLLDGVDVGGLSHRDLIQLRRDKLAMVFQSFALLPYLSVWENVAFGLKVSGMPKRERRQRAGEILERVGLAEHAESAPSDLSGGMQQRVGLARALAVDPEVLLMDEAFSALDPLIRTQMQDELMRLQNERPRTIVFISHDLDEAVRIGDRIAVMEAGRVLQVGTPEELLESPKTDLVRTFFHNVDVGAIYRAADVVRTNPLTIVERHANSLRVGLQRLDEGGRDYGYVQDVHGKFLGVVSADSLLREYQAGRRELAGAFLDIEPLPRDASLEAITPKVTRSACPLPVVDEQGQLIGIVSKTALLERLKDVR